MTRSFHFRDPAKTPELRAIFDCCFRSPNNYRAKASSLDIVRYLRDRGMESVRPASDISELRHWFNARENWSIYGHPTHYVADAELDRTTEKGKRVYLFVIYTWNDPRAVAARRAHAEREQARMRRAA